MYIYAICIMYVYIFIYIYMHICPMYMHIYRGRDMYIVCKGGVWVCLVHTCTPATQFTCFTSTKVQILTQLKSRCAWTIPSVQHTVYSDLIITGMNSSTYSLYYYYSFTTAGVLRFTTIYTTVPPWSVQQVYPDFIIIVISSSHASCKRFS